MKERQERNLPPIITAGQPRRFCFVPSMKPSLEVKVLRGYRLRKTQAKRKAVCREAYAERSVELIEPAPADD